MEAFEILCYAVAVAVLAPIILPIVFWLVLAVSGVLVGVLALILTAVDKCMQPLRRHKFNRRLRNRKG